MKIKFLIILFLIILAPIVYSNSIDPIVSIISGPQKGFSTIELIWPDGVVDTFTYENEKFSPDEDKEYKAWLTEKINEFKNRNGVKKMQSQSSK